MHRRRSPGDLARPPRCRGITSLDYVLKIDGNTGDTLPLFESDGWGAANTVILSGYAIYTEGAVKIAIDKDIAVTLT